MSNVEMFTVKAGFHTCFRICICESIYASINCGSYAMQIFMGNPKGFTRQVITEKDMTLSRELVDRFPMHIFTHFPYIANLNGSADSLCWNGDSKIDAKMSFLLKQLEYELSIVSKLHLSGFNSGVVIHPGCYGKREEGLATISKTINKIKFSPNSKLILENCAGEGRKLCKNFKEIKTIFNKLEHDKLNHVGVCVDTAHIWGEGLYDLSTFRGIDLMFQDFDSILGFENFTLLHLNDSKVPLGSKKDRHEMLGRGFIWRHDIAPLKYLVEKCDNLKIPIILETHPFDILTLNKLNFYEE